MYCLLTVFIYFISLLVQLDKRENAMKQILCSILVLCLFTGCASVDTAGPSKMNGMKLDDTSNFAHVNARTWGLNFFPQYPVLYPSEGKVNIQTTTQLLTNKARDIGADTITDIESDVYNWKV